MKKTLLITDHKWRDLAGNTYLKFLLEKSGDVKVRLCRLGEDRFWVLHDRPDVVIYNNFYEDRKVRFGYWLKKQNVGIVILPTENLPFERGKEIFSGKFTDFAPIDIYLSWTEEIADEIVNSQKLPASKVKIVGVPRFDFYFSPLTRLLPRKTEIQKKYGLHQNPNAKIILYATNFTIAGFCNNKDFLYKDWDALKLNRVDGYKPDQIDARVSNDMISRGYTVESVKQLLADFPDLQVIYKPHPSENHAFYHEIIKEFKCLFPGRFAFVVQEYIWNLLNISDLLIQRSCTTALEGWMCNKPTLELHFLEDEAIFSEKLSHGSDIVRNSDDIKRYVNYYMQGGKISESVRKYHDSMLENWCFKLDGKRTIETADIILDFIRSKNNATYIISLKDFLRFYPIEYAKQFYRFCRNLLRKIVIGVDSLGRIDKQFMKKDARFWEDQIASIYANDITEPKH